MRRVTGIGGIVFKSREPAVLQAWYRTHLGIAVQAWGGAALDWVDEAGQPAGGTTAWRVSGDEDFGPGAPSFMVTYRVADLAGLLAALRAEGCTVLDKTDDSEYGKFGWAVDPDGNKVELWEPPTGQ